MNGIPITPSVLRVQEKVEAASERSILAGALARQRVLDLGLAEKERLARKEGAGKIIQKYGEITVEQGRKDIEADDEDEARVVNMRHARLSKPWRNKYKKMMRRFEADYWDVINWKMKATDHDLWGK
jgi:hypothetical protein